MKIADRLAARMQRSADRRDERYRQHLEAVRAGTAAPTLVERLTAPAPGQSVAEAAHRHFEKVGRVIQLLAGPVSGPDGIPVLICLCEHSRRYPWSRPPKLPVPESWARAIAAEPTLTGQVARIQMWCDYPGFVYAYAMSGPRLRLRRKFMRRGRLSGDPLAYVLALAEDVRSRGVAALRQSPPPGVSTDSARPVQDE
jgi:hypothetical protein